MELKVEAVWQQVLQRSSQISIAADFVTIGGNSLLAGRATSILRKVLCAVCSCELYALVNCMLLCTRLRVLPEL